jgi:talin
MDLYYKKKHRLIKVKLADQSVKTALVDDSTTVLEITNVICTKLGINNPEEFALRVDGKPESKY